jgi:hypothetical protein
MASISINLFVNGDSRIRVHNHVDTFNNFVTISVDDVTLYVKDIEAATRLANAALEGINAFGATVQLDTKVVEA